METRQVKRAGKGLVFVIYTAIIMLLVACQPMVMEPATPTVPEETPVDEIVPETGITPSPVLTPEPVATPTPEAEADVEVSDQEILDSSVTIDLVSSPGPGWIVIHADQDGAPGPVIGYAPVIDMEEDVVVEIDVANATGTLHAMLHEDAGTVGEYEFPGPDQPVLREGEVVNVPFQITGGLEEEAVVQEARVSVIDSAFSPGELTVSPGTTVIWTNSGDLPHTVTADDGSFDSGTLQYANRFEHTFNEPGTYPYHCNIHGGTGGAGMAGVIIVETP